MKKCEMRDSREKRRAMRDQDPSFQTLLTSVTKAEAFKLKRRFCIWMDVDGESFKNGLFENDDVTKIT